MVISISTTQHSYTLSGLLTSPPQRLDDRTLLAFRPLHISTGIAPQAAGSAQCLLGGTRCVVVVSAEIVDGAEAGGPCMSCDVDCPSSIPQGTNLTSLLLTLQKTLASTLSSSSISKDQFVVLRSASRPYQPTKTWSLHVDVTFTDIQGGNLADVMFAAVWAAINNVRLPKTRAIGFDTDLLNSNRGTEGNLDSFDIKGSLAKTRGTAAALSNAQKTAGTGATTGSSSAQPQQETDPLVMNKTGIDFEVMDVWDSGVPIEGCEDLPIAVTVNMLPGSVMLDATLTEETCVPTSRRLLVLCSPSTGRVIGTQMIPSTLDIGLSGSEESTTKSARPITGTADYTSIRQAMRDGLEYARGLHGAIKSQMASTSDTAMETV
ncbi:hypothetical protein CBS101457_002734 [Exobasidium rhododendri]|nr:hypothetical protein CBS101457_002734 [Exobasidium rhododendri]